MNNNDVIIRYLSGNASEEERHYVEEWRRQIGNAEVFEEYEKVWKASGNLKQTIFPDTERAWEKFNAEVTLKSTKPFYTRPRAWIAAAAVLVPIMIFIVIANENTGKRFNSEGKNPAQLVMNAVTANDSIVEYVLPDNSVVWLNKNSKLFVSENYGINERVVKMEGEAYFEVAKNEKLPFIIYAYNSITKVTGTEFNIKAYKDKHVELKVHRGAVEFFPNQKSEKIVLNTDEKIQLNIATSEVTKTKNTDKEVWKTGKQHKFKKFLGKIRDIFKKES